MELQNKTYATARNRIRDALLEDMYTHEDIEVEAAMRRAFDRIAVATCHEAERLGVSATYLEEIDIAEDFYAVDAELRELEARAALRRRKEKRAEYRLRLFRRIRRRLRSPFFGDRRR